MDDLIPYFQKPSSETKLFEFGEEDIDKGDINSIPDEEIYDAVNDETFGGEISTTVDEDFEQFSTRTANLALLDEPNSSSIQLPDPSQIPIPKIGGNPFKKDTNAGAGEPLSSIWSTDSFNGIGSLTNDYIGNIKTEQQMQQHSSIEDLKNREFQSLIESGMKHSAPLINYVHQPSMQVSSGAESKYFPSSITNKSPFAVNDSAPLNLEELERRMLIEAAAIHHKQQASQYPSSSINPSDFTHPLTTTNGTFRPIGDVPNQLPQLPQNQLLHHFNQIYQLAAATAASSGLPPPPLTPFHSPFAPPGMASVGANIPITTLWQRDATPGPSSSSISGPGYNTQPIAIPQAVIAMPQFSMIPASLHPRVEGRRKIRQNGLPSGKTISDFALDPYAGFMSTKEREWLIKIHIIQCMGSGDPMEDDFYYTAWKKQNVLQKAPDNLKSKEKPKYYRFEATYPSSGYTAPSFLGTLGKPVHSSSSQPRQIIEVCGDANDDDLSSGKNRQKRLRAVLVKIENAALSLIDCKNIRRKLRFFEETRITEYLEQREITDRTARYAENLIQVDNGIFSYDSLPTLMLVQKGRRLIYEWMSFWREEECDRETELIYAKRMLECLPKFAKKMPREAIKPFVDNMCAHFSNFSHSQIVDLINCCSKWEHASFISESKLAQITTITLVLAALQITDGSLQLQTLQGTSADLVFKLPLSALMIHPKSEVDREIIKPSHWAQLRQWLIREQTGNAHFVQPGSLAHWIAQNQDFILI